MRSALRTGFAYDILLILATTELAKNEPKAFGPTYSVYGRSQRVSPMSPPAVPPRVPFPLVSQRSVPPFAHTHTVGSHPASLSRPPMARCDGNATTRHSDRAWRNRRFEHTPSVLGLDYPCGNRRGCLTVVAESPNRSFGHGTM